MSKNNKFLDKKINGFRMWKSGKKWLFGATIITATSFIIETQTVSASSETNTVSSAVVNSNSSTGENGSIGGTPSTGPESDVEAVTPKTETIATVSNDPASETAAVPMSSEGTPVAASLTPSSEDKSTPAPRSVRSASTSEPVEETKEFKIEQFSEKKPVTIHFETDDNNAKYYAWVWGTGIAEQDDKFNELTNNNGKHEITLNVKPEKTYLNYIITKGQGWNNGAVKQTGNMVATVNEFAPTHVYIGKDKSTNSGKKSWYTQTSAQEENFDKMFAYEDKVVDTSEPDNFKTVGSLGRLGATLNEETGEARLNLWAPTAKSVKVNIYKTEAGYNSERIFQIDMKRGTVSNQDNYQKNTVGVWTADLTQEILKKHGLSTAEKLSYDYELEIPNAYFIQAEDKKKKVNDNTWVHDYYIYRNSKTGKVLNGVKDAILGEREAKWEEVASFYASDAVVHKDQSDLNSEIIPQEQVYQKVQTQDPYSVALTQNGSRSVILNPSKYGKVTQSNAKRVSSLSELSVMEMDVRDFSIDEKSGVSVKNRGNFLGVIEDTKTDKGKLTGLNYLKYTGVKYVQIMPVNDFQSVPELLPSEEDNTKLAEKEKDGVHNNQQNWGYDPKNYNAPDGSYSSDPSKPEVRIEELKKMVQGLHNAGINVVLDVVYNHLFDGQRNPFEWTVPGYYYAVNGDGAMNNDVGVGNAVRSNSRMMRQYIVNSVVYWATEYGIDGFRFDAMSDLDTKTLSDVRTALNKIDPKIVTYGEGWDSMGNYLKGDGDEVKASIGNAKRLPTYGFFDSTGRDAIAGSQYNEHGGAQGFVNRQSDYKSRLLDQVTKSLLGGLDQNYANPSQQLNYVEVHDGKTLYDLLKKYNEADSEVQLKNRVQLATAMSALSQGIHFSQMGQEFARTKNHEHNTYNGGDELNKIDWKLVEQNPDMVNFYKALVAFRTQEPLMHLTDYRDVNGQIGKPKMVITNAQENSGIITYELRGEKGDRYLVVFNNNTATENQGSLTLGGANSWYYGGKLDQQPLNHEGNRGRINDNNDFTNAFIVLSNSKNLYDRIGKTVGEKTVTLDHLSATVFYIPAEPKLLEMKTVKQTIHYVNKKGDVVSPEKERKVSFVTVTRQDPNFKFTFEKSAINTTEKDLGHKQNILTGLRDNAEVTYAYYAVDASTGKGIEVKEQPRLDDKGEPISNGKVIWKKVEGAGLVSGFEGEQLPEGYTRDKEKWLSSVRYHLEEVSHPKVEGYKVIEVTPHNVGNTEKIDLSALSIGGDNDIKVIYAKQSRAIIVSDNDPESNLQDKKQQPSQGYYVEGYEDEPILFNQSQIKLERLGYTYTINGKSSLEEAIKDTPKFGELDTVFNVVYLPKAAKAKVKFIDIDNNNDVVEEKIITGNTSNAFEVDFSSIDKDKYDILEVKPDKTAGSYYFDKIDDTDNISQVITVSLKHKHEISQIETVNRVVYKGVPNQQPKETIVTWTVDKDLVTNLSTYKPNIDQTIIDSPVVADYYTDEKSVTFENQAGDAQPNNQLKEVTYRPVIPLTKLEPAQPIIPLTKLEPAQPVIPLTKLEPAQPVIPLTKLEPAQPVIPLTE
ncbi:KxYKxGKxW signal peptide domain-containing protein [Streptococcus sp. S784/96/1]|uniref:KxYKxGKxW signal peptide domain-containing protein n=1 Tax=Streptococcus sp. S784/96/1 TaxID=2653499 RepID=UPI0012E9D6BD|nr:alpha-amylase family glycosyl hydrolase [Streptococcus sp. S784/96/1]